MAILDFIGIREVAICLETIEGNNPHTKYGNPFQWIIIAAEKIRESHELIARLGIPNKKPEKKRSF
jgi:hypothetical protein